MVRSVALMCSLTLLVVVGLPAPMTASPALVQRGRMYYTPEAPHGSLRIRATPKTAEVFIDGALAGTVADFDGITHHLDLDPGVHELVLRADGYAPYSTQVTVRFGKTITARATLKKSSATGK